MQYNYSTHALEQFSAAIASCGQRVVINGQGMRFSEGITEPMTPLVGMLSTAPKFELPDNGDVLRNWGKVLEMATGDDLHLPYPVTVLEYSFSDCSRMEADKVLIPKRLVVCLEFDSCKDSYFGRQAQKMLRDSIKLDGSIIIVPIYCIEGFWMPYPFACVITSDRSGGASGLLFNENGRRIESSVGYCTFPINGVHAQEMIDDNGLDGAYEISMADVAEEVFVVLGLTVSLSCSNIEVIDTPAPEKLNRKRVKNGKLPFFGYKRIEIRPASADRGGRVRGQSMDGRQSPRLHHRRGHIRNLRGGAKRVWVSPAMVGSGTKGFVKSSYRVGG